MGRDSARRSSNKPRCERVVALYGMSIVGGPKFDQPRSELRFGRCSVFPAPVLDSKSILQVPARSDTSGREPSESAPRPTSEPETWDIWSKSALRAHIFVRRISGCSNLAPTMDDPAKSSSCRDALPPGRTRRQTEAFPTMARRPRLASEQGRPRLAVKRGRQERTRLDDPSFDRLVSDHIRWPNYPRSGAILPLRPRVSDSLHQCLQLQANVVQLRTRSDMRDTKK